MTLGALFTVANTSVLPGWLLLVPCLFFTPMLGPLGLLLHLAIRFALLRDRRATGLAEEAIAPG